MTSEFEVELRGGYVRVGTYGEGTAYCKISLRNVTTNKMPKKESHQADYYGPQRDESDKKNPGVKRLKHIFAHDISFDKDLIAWFQRQNAFMKWQDIEKNLTKDGAKQNLREMLINLLRAVQQGRVKAYSKFSSEGERVQSKRYLAQDDDEIKRIGALIDRKRDETMILDSRMDSALPDSSKASLQAGKRLKRSLVQASDGTEGESSEQRAKKTATGAGSGPAPKPLEEQAMEPIAQESKEASNGSVTAFAVGNSSVFMQAGSTFSFPEVVQGIKLVVVNGVLQWAST